MKVVAALDSFKGSISSIEAGEAVREGIKRADARIEVIVKPLADGGEGTMQALTEGMGGRFIRIPVTGPMGKETEACYGMLPDKTAVMEMAQAAGITLVGSEKRDLSAATTFGVGEMILDAVKRGSRQFIIGIGGSATNDGGVGMLQALGLELLDANAEPVERGAKGLSQIEIIRESEAFRRVTECRFLIACDVSNPLCGQNGATWVYGPQKGLTEEQKLPLDRAMGHFAEKTAAYRKKDNSREPGAGAAGGLGFAFLSYLQAELKPGIQLVMDAVGLEACICEADYVVTGEGRLDAQTAMGKAPAGVAALAAKHGATVIALAGSVAPEAGECRHMGITAYFSILSEILTLEEAMDKKRTKENIIRTAEQIFRLLSVKL